MPCMVGRAHFNWYCDDENACGLDHERVYALLILFAAKMEI